MEQFNVGVLTLLSGDGQPFDIDLPRQEGRLAAVDDIRLDGHDGIPSSLLISLTARVDAAAGVAGCAASHWGASGGTTQRLYWIGSAPSRWVRARLRRDRRRVDWRLSVHPTRIREVSISARVDRIERLPGSLESAFGHPLQQGRGL